MRKNRNMQENGITLIALIITIIIMLILAGVTINLTLGENGIFATAQKAAKNYTNAHDKEIAELGDFTNLVNNTISGIEQGTNIGGTTTPSTPETPQQPAPLPENTPTTPSGTQVQKPAGKTWDETKINSYADGAGNTIPVPVGFSPITVAEGQGTQTTGFVIKDTSVDSAGNPTATNGNEFVWVPCTIDGANGSIKYDRYDFGKYGGSYSNYSETLPEDERDSIATYGGYYIGRYEAGIEGGTKGATENDGTYYTGDNMKLVVKEDQQVWNYITRDRAVTEATALYNKSKNNVASKLCSSYAWDTALKFIETQNSTYPTYSVGGYYGGSASTPTTTGYDTTHPCNIYDMGGNVWEWTTELYNATGDTFVDRGGSSYNSALDNPAGYRYYWNISVIYDYIGFRVALYM